MNHCKAKRPNGTRCNARPNASGYCFAHDPKRKRDADQARKLGGKHRRRIETSDTPFPDADPLTVNGLAKIVGATMRQCWVLENSIARGRTLAYLAATQRAILETSDLETRIADLEKITRERGDGDPETKGHASNESPSQAN